MIVPEPEDDADRVLQELQAHLDEDTPSADTRQVARWLGWTERRTRAALGDLVGTGALVARLDRVHGGRSYTLPGLAGPAA